METYIENCVNSGDISLEIILSEGLRVTFQPDYVVMKDGTIYYLFGGNVSLVKTRKAGYKRKYIQAYFKAKGAFRGGNAFIHRVVAQHFLENSDPLVFTQVNHMDGDTENNNSDNLEWVTPKQNMKHAYDTGLSLKGAACPWAVHSEELINAICKMIEDGFTTKDIQVTLGIKSKSLVSKIRKKRQWVSVSSKYNF